MKEDMKLLWLQNILFVTCVLISLCFF